MIDQAYVIRCHPFNIWFKQLKQWGCKYTTANVGKPVYDIWIDDKAQNDKSYFDNVLSIDILDKFYNETD